MQTGITLLSGGLDSMVSSAMARLHLDVVCALTFDYGQRAAPREIAAAAQLCALWGIEHQVITLPWLSELTSTALVNTTQGVPEYTGDLRALDDGCRAQASAEAVWVPNRNGVFINIAAAVAEARKLDVIITGFNAEEAATFPDNSITFIERTNAYLEFATLQRPIVVSDTQDMHKHDIVGYALTHELPLQLCWPCYHAGDKWCGRCESCARLLRALRGHSDTCKAARTTLQDAFEVPL